MNYFHVHCLVPSYFGTCMIQNTIRLKFCHFKKKLKQLKDVNISDYDQPCN